MFIFFVLSNVSSQSNDSNSDYTMRQIKNNTWQTANNTQKDSYYYLSVVISIMGLSVSCITLFYTFFTYKSQMQTQKNTTPILTSDNQYEAFVSIGQNLIDNYLDALVMRTKLIKSKPTEYISDINFLYQKIDTESIHVELFHSAMPSEGTFFINDSLYLKINKIKHSIDVYNHYYDIIAKHCCDKSIKKDVIFDELDNFISNYILHILIEMTEFCKEAFIRKTDLREHLVSYIWFRKNIHTLIESDNRLNQNDYDLEMANIISEAINVELFELLFEDFDFSSVLKDEVLNVNSVIMLLIVATMGDYKHNNLRNKIIMRKH